MSRLLSTYTDQELAHRLQALDDRDAYTEIFLRYNRVLIVHAYKRLGNKGDAQDAVQEVFAALWSKRREITIASNLAGYLHIALRNKIYNLLAHEQVATDYAASLQQFIHTQADATDYGIREQQMHERIEKEKSLLPPRMREVFELSREQQLSHREIALALNIAESTVTDQVKKALRILRPKLLD